MRISLTILPTIAFMLAACEMEESTPTGQQEESPRVQEVQAVQPVQEQAPSEPETTIPAPAVTGVVAETDAAMEAAAATVGESVAVAGAAVAEQEQTDTTEPPAKPQISVTIGARDVKETNLDLLQNSHGTPEQPVLTWGPRDQDKFANFEVTVDEEGDYKLYVTLASNEARPFAVDVNGETALKQVGAEKTGSYDVISAKKFLVGSIPLRAGTNVVAIKIAGSAPCLASICVEK